MKQVITLLILLTTIGLCAKEMEKEKQTEDKTVVEILKTGAPKKVFFMDGSSSEIDAKLDSILSANGIDQSEHNASVHILKNSLMADSLMFEIENEVGVDVHDMFGFHHPDFKMFFLNDSDIVQSTISIQTKIREMQKMMEEFPAIHKDILVWQDSDSIQTKNWNMARAALPQDVQQNDEAIVIQGDAGDPYQSIILNPGKDLQKDDEIEITTKKKKNVTTITIRKK